MLLRKLEKKDITGMLEWMHDSNVNKYFRFDAAKMDRKKAEQFVEKAVNQFAEKTSFHYAIVNDEDVYLGTISLKNINYEAGNAEYAISLRKCCQRKGIGSAATIEILRIAFEDLGLERVYLNVIAENEPAIQFYEKTGFIYEGEFRRHLLVRNKLSSLKWYAILKEDYVMRIRRTLE